MKIKQLHTDIVLCGNGAFINHLNEVKTWFAEREVTCYLSYEDKTVWNHYDIFTYDRYMENAYASTVRKIRDPRTYCIIVFNFDLYGITNYIDPSVFAEIAIASTQGKKIYTISPFPDIYEKELAFWNCKNINGNLELVYSEVKKIIRFNTQQMSLFS